MKIAINKCWGGFSLSDAAVRRYAEIKGIKLVESPQPYGRVDFSTESGEYFSSRPDDRTEDALIQVIEELGAEADGTYADIRIIEIPDGISWYIHDYDGRESVHESHQSWG